MNHDPIMTENKRKELRRMREKKGVSDANTKKSALVAVSHT